MAKFAQQGVCGFLSRSPPELRMFADSFSILFLARFLYLSNSASRSGPVVLWQGDYCHKLTPRASPFHGTGHFLSICI